MRRGDLFVAIHGRRDDGARYAREAVARGARVVVAERDDLELPPEAALVVVPDARRALAHLACSHQGHPSRGLGLVGVTGTDGKTTTTTLIAELFEAAGLRTGLRTTVGERVGSRIVPNRCGRTTPEAPEVQDLLGRALRSGCRWAVLEVSSHGLALERVTGCTFDVAVLTNLSPEHLDFHGSIAGYRAAKARLFEMLGDGQGKKATRRLGVINADDRNAAYFRAVCPVEVLTFGFDRSADVRARDLTLGRRHTSFVLETPIGERRLDTRLVGRFNVANWLAAVAVAIGQGLGWDAIERAAATARPVRGRVQRIRAGQPFPVLVDFAHTPQGLAAAIESARAMTRGRVIVVFGHPGERDDSNRPRLGAVAIRDADLAIVTGDDAYGEDPRRVLEQVAAGARAAGGLDGETLLVIPDRRAAISEAIGAAGPGDAVLIAGRGHLRHLEIAGQHIPFEDARVTREELGRRYLLA